MVYSNRFVPLFACRLVILCHLSGLTAAGYTYVSTNFQLVINKLKFKYIKSLLLATNMLMIRAVTQLTAFSHIMVGYGSSWEVDVTGKLTSHWYKYLFIK